MIATLLRRIADWLDPPTDDTPPFTYSVSLDHLTGPIERSDPIDFDGLWREQVTDGSAYIEENDVYRPGNTYL